MATNSFVPLLPLSKSLLQPRLPTRSCLAPSFVTAARRNVVSAWAAISLPAAWTALLLRPRKQLRIWNGDQTRTWSATLGYAVPQHSMIGGNQMCKLVWHRWPSQPQSRPIASRLRPPGSRAKTGHPGSDKDLAQPIVWIWTSRNSTSP